MKDSAEVHKRALSSRLGDLKRDYQALLDAFGTGNSQESRTKLAKGLLLRARTLQEMLDYKDVPGWLTEIDQTIHNFNGNDTRQHRDLLMTLMRLKTEVEAESFDTSVSSSGKYDDVFDRLRSEHKLSELFDFLVEKILEIVNSGELDSITVSNALQEIVSVLKANRNGSYFSMLTAFSYTRFGWNLIVESLRLLPGLNVVIAAIEKTMEQGESDLKAIDGELREVARQKLIKAIPNIERLPEYRKQQLALEAPVRAETPIDAEFEVKQDKTGASSQPNG